MKYEDRVPSTIPTTAELEAAPMIDRWQVIEAEPWKHGQIWGYFRGHPEIADGTYAHSSPVIYLEDKERPTWAVCRKRIYLLGKPMGAAEARIRELCRCHSVDGALSPFDEWLDKIAELSGEEVTEGDEIERRLATLRRGEWITADEGRALWRAYIDERDGER